MKTNSSWYRAEQKVFGLYLKLISDEPYLSRDRQVGSFEISTNTTWSISSPLPKWLKIAPQYLTFNKGNKVIPFEVDENLLASYRDTEVIITSIDNSKSITIVFTQLGSDVTPYLNLNPETKTVPYTENTYVFTIDSNIMFYVEYPNPDVELNEVS